MSELFHARYDIHGEIGKGRVSTVYRATDTFTGNIIALKIFSAHEIPGHKSLEYLDSELEKRKALSHPHLVRILDKGHHQEKTGLPTIFLSLEFIQGGTLAQRISRLQNHPYTLKEILLLLLQVIDALDYLHSQEICITNLDPKRILLRDDDTVKLPAFGFVTTAQWLRHGSQLSRASGVDYRYVAPEMIQEFGVMTGNVKTDMYLFGILAFELGSGTAPYDANKQTLIQLHRTEPVPDTLPKSDLPSWYDQFVRQCMEKEPEKRLSVTQVRKLLLKKLSGDSGELALVPKYVDQSGVRVLFVEDNKLDQLSLARFAKRERYPFTYKIAHSVAKAKEMLEERVFDVVVSDFMLPDGTAVDVIQTSTVPTIVVTGAGKEDVAAAALKAGAYDYIPKDMKHQHLKDIPHVVMRAFEYGQAVKQRDKFAERIRNLEQQCDMEMVQRRIVDRVYDFLSISFAHIQKARENLENRKEIAASLDHLERACEHAQFFIHQILATSPISAFESPAEGGACVGEASEEVIAELQGKRSWQNIEFNVWGSARDIRLALPYLSLKQVLLHLCTNACEAIGEARGRVNIMASISQERTLMIDQPEFLSGHYGVISIEDSGPGISPGLEAHFFEPFVTTKSQEEGHRGTGLSTVKTIIRQAGGYIVVNRPPHGGARFDLYVPLQQDEKACLESADNEDIPFESVSLPRHGEGQLLLAENDKELQGILGRTLTQQGFTVTLIETLEDILGELACESTNGTRLFIANDNLPYLHLVLSRLDRKVTELPVIQYCNYIGNLPPHCFRKNQQFYYLQKPIVAHRLLRVITYCLEREDRQC